MTDYLDLVDMICSIGADEDASDAEKSAVVVVVGFLTKKEIRRREEYRAQHFARKPAPPAGFDAENLPANVGWYRKEPPAKPGVNGGHTHGKSQVSMEKAAEATAVLATLGDEILGVLQEMIRQEPCGPTCKMLATKLDAAEHQVRAAMRSLNTAGRARMMRRHDTASWHLVPVGYEPPVCELTPAQESVLKALAERADDEGVVTMSKAEFSESSGVSYSVVCNVIHALVKKDMIKQESKGGGPNASTYRILHDGRMALEK